MLAIVDTDCVFEALAPVTATESTRLRAGAVDGEPGDSDEGDVGSAANGFVPASWPSSSSAAAMARSSNMSRSSFCAEFVISDSRSV